MNVKICNELVTSRMSIHMRILPACPVPIAVECTTLGWVHLGRPSVMCQTCIPSKVQWLTTKTPKKSNCGPFSLCNGCTPKTSCFCCCCVEMVLCAYVHMNVSVAQKYSIFFSSGSLVSWLLSCLISPISRMNRWPWSCWPTSWRTGVMPPVCSWQWQPSTGTSSPTPVARCFSLTCGWDDCACARTLAWRSDLGEKSQHEMEIHLNASNNLIVNTSFMHISFFFFLMFWPNLTFD